VGALHERRDSLPGRPGRRRLRLPHRARLHPLQLERALPLQGARGVPEHRDLADTKWREARFFFTSRLPGEPAGGVPDVHFTPGNPRTFLGGIGLHF